MAVEDRTPSKIFNPSQKVIYEGGLYHIIQRAPGKDVLFLENRDFLYFTHLLKETNIKFFLTIFCFCLMPNHVHILLRINKTNLSEAMKYLFGRYAMYFNAKYQRKGHVFYGKYRASLCWDDRYLITASIYIHLNPYKAKLVSHPVDYQWSSFGAYIKRPRRTFLDYQYILKILAEDLEKATDSYRQILSDAARLEFRNIVEDYRFMGKFSFQLFNKIKEIAALNRKNDSDLEWKVIEQLKEKKRLKKPQDIAARKYLIEQLKARGYSFKDIAQIINLSRQSIHATLNSVT